MPQQPETAREPGATRPPEKVEQQPEPAPKPEKRTPARRATPKAAVDANVEAAPPAQPKPAEIPQLGPMMSEQEMRELDRAIDAALSSAEQNLRAVRSRERNTRQQTMLDQAEAFARQARETRPSDPVAAKSLAERADQLSHELVSTYR
jgi:uncharacterized protein YicC (UPF0701 family)